MVQFGDQPLEVPLEIIETLRSREDGNGLINFAAHSTYKLGDTVQILDGAFCDAIGKLEKLDNQERVTMLLDLMGRQVRIKTTLKNITAVN
jgi:transcriptional antiterminator RfaH